MSRRYGPFTERELANKLAKVPDAEIIAYHQKRIWRARYFYLAGLGCGAGAVPFIFLSNVVACILLGISGIAFVKYGRMQRDRWQMTFQTLMGLRGKPLVRPDGKFLFTKKKESS